MIILTDKGTKHIKDQNADAQGYSEYEITKIRRQNRVYRQDSKNTLGPVKGRPSKNDRGSNLGI